MHPKIVSASEAAQIRDFNSDPDHIERSWPRTGIPHLTRIFLARGGSDLNSFRQTASEKRIGVRGGPDPLLWNRSRSICDTSGPTTYRKKTSESEADRMQEMGSGMQDVDRLW